MSQDVQLREEMEESVSINNIAAAGDTLLAFTG